MYCRRYVQSLVVVLALGLAFSAEIPASAADILLVPDDFPTIQAAVDAANPNGGDTVMVGPGDFAGAVITNPVRIIGSGDDTRITSGTFVYSEDAFDLLGDWFEVGGTEIRDLVIEYEGLGYGVFVNMANDVTIANVTINSPLYMGVYVFIGDGSIVTGNTVNDAYRAIDIRYGSGCEVMHNNVIGLTVPAGTGTRHADGIFLGETNNCVVAHNYVRHVGTAVGGFDEEGYIGLGVASLGSPTEANNFHHNQVEVSVTGADWSVGVAFVDYGILWYGLPKTLQRNKAMHNDFCGSSTGVAFNPVELEDYNKAKFNRCGE